MFNWIRNIRRKRNTKKFIKQFLDNAVNSIIVEKWCHNSWGDAIYINGNGFYGHLPSLRCPDTFPSFYCDLRDRDIIVMEIPQKNRTKSNGKKYEIGLFANVRIQSNPPDMFFAKYLRLGFANDYSRETIIKLAKQRIKEL